MYKYKTKDGGDLTIVGFGATVGGYITSATPIENPNLELMTEEATPAPVNIEIAVPVASQPVMPNSEQKPNIGETN